MLPDPDHLQRLLLPSFPPFLTTEMPQAAVLLVLCPGEAGSVTILTRRSAEMPIHPDQISLPGGRVHAGDCSLEATALREAREETGLDETAVRVLGRLPVIMVSSGFAVTPIVVWAASRPDLEAEPREVAELIDCPLSLILDLASYKSDFVLTKGIKREFYYIEFDEYYVWGATAAILRSLAQVIGPDQHS